jgi:hypothetical protein
MIEIKAPATLYTLIPPNTKPNPSVFLAGSIEQGKAEMWQDRVVAMLKDTDWTIFNPRRDDWDESLKQTPDDPQFRTQVEWELTAQEMADRIIMYFDATTLSPVSLLELGLFGPSGRMRVVCNNGFWRRGNVQLVCERYQIPMFDTLEQAVGAL